jgi:cold shock protein
MKTGIVKFYNEEKGFGFIKEANTGEEIFVHRTGLVDAIKEGDTVSFEIVEGKKGENAAKVKKV